MGMAVPYGIHNLEEDAAGFSVLTHILALLSDLGEQIAFRAVLQDNKGAILGLEDLLHGNNIRMLAGLVMQPDLSILEVLLSLVKAEPVQGLHSILGMRLQIYSSVDSTIRSNTKNGGQLNLMLRISER